MNGKTQLHNHYNGLKTALLFAIMWAIIMIIWWATGASVNTLGYYVIIGLGASFVSYWFSDKLAMLLFAIMWAIIMIIWWATGASVNTLGYYVIIGLGASFVSYWFSDKLAIASMHAQPVTEQQAPELYRIVRELSQKAGKPMPRIYVAPTATPNAFATGRNERHAAVCCTQGILRILDEREIRGVLGHELMHVYNHDIRTSAIAGAMATVISYLCCTQGILRILDEREIRGVLGHELMHVYNHDIRTSAIAGAMATVISYLGYSLMYFGNSTRSNRDSDNGAGALGAVGAMLSVILAPIAASLIQMAISRTREYDADEDGSVLTGDPLALASALYKIENGVAANPMPPTATDRSVAAMMIESPFSARGISKMFSTHPPTAERIARLQQMAAAMGAPVVNAGMTTGEVGPGYAQLYSQTGYRR